MNQTDLLAVVFRGQAMSTKALNIEEFINSRGVGRFQLLIGVLGILILIADGFDIQIIAYLIPQITREWGIGTSTSRTSRSTTSLERRARWRCCRTTSPRVRTRGGPKG